MKKKIYILLLVSIIAVSLFVTGCSGTFIQKGIVPDQLLENAYVLAIYSLGMPETKEFYSDSSIGPDWNEFGIYKYSSNDLPNAYFNEVNSKSEQEILSVIEKFENFIGLSDKRETDITLNYSFDKSYISDDDFYWMHDGGSEFSLCYFDTGTNTMYLFRST